MYPITDDLFVLLLMAQAWNFIHMMRCLLALPQVLCCVNMYLLLGNEMSNELAQLTDVQRRLVQLYVNRIYTKRKEAEENETHG